MDTRTGQILLTNCKRHNKHYISVYDQHFYGGRGGGGGWVGGSSERCLSSERSLSSERCLKCCGGGGGGWGSLRDLSKNILKQGVGKGESCL